MAGRLKSPDPFVLRHTTFPLLALSRVEGAGKRVMCDPVEQGSAFFLSRDGLFLTAKHVVSAYDTSSYSVLAVNMRDRVRKFCRVTELARHPELDVAVGRAEWPNEDDGWPFPVTLATGRIGIGASVLVYGYPNTGITVLDPDGDKSLGLDFRPQMHAAKIDDYMPDGAPLIKAPCYVVSGDPGGGISGSPLIRKRTGHVHAVVCRGNTTEGAGIASYAVALDVRAFVDGWSISFLGGISLREHFARGAFAVR